MNRINRPLSRRFLLLGLLISLLVGCSNTVVQESWTAPDLEPAEFSKIFVLGLASSDLNRRLAEVGMRYQIHNYPVVASYEYMDNMEDLRDKEKVLAAIKKSGADCLIVMRMLTSDTNVSHSNINMPLNFLAADTYYGVSTYNVADIYAYSSTNTAVESIFMIETNIFDVRTEQKIFSTLTKSKKNQVEDRDVKAIVTEVAKTVKAELSRHSVIKR